MNMHALWEREFQSWLARTKKLVIFHDTRRDWCTWVSHATMMHAVSQQHLYLRPEILTVTSVAYSKKEAHVTGRHTLYVLFRHLIKQPRLQLPSYVEMALEFTKKHPVFVNPSAQRLNEMGSLIAFDTEGGLFLRQPPCAHGNAGNNAEYFQVTDGRKTFIYNMQLAESRAAVKKILLSQRHKLVWGGNDERRLQLCISPPVTGTLNVGGRLHALLLKRGCRCAGNVWWVQP
jgi:hypothetical protein